jgi:hypothetical protein
MEWLVFLLIPVIAFALLIGSPKSKGTRKKAAKNEASANTAEHTESASADVTEKETIESTTVRDEAAMQTPTYTRRASLMSKAERSFYGVLAQAVGEEYRIFAKVRVADVLKPAKGMDKSQWRKAFNQINRKHFDFVLCERDDLRFVYAIELDDKSHDNDERKSRDRLIDKACKEAGLPLIHIRAARGYAPDALRHQILSSQGESS